MKENNSLNFLNSLREYPYIAFELPDRFFPREIRNSVDIPDLLSIQKETFDLFLQEGVPAEKRLDVGIHRVLSTLKFQIPGRKLEYVDYQLDPPRYTPEECKARELTYSSIMKVKLRLTIFEDENNLKPKEIREEWVYFGEIPRMTQKCSFVISGTEKVVVNQLHKSPGVYFEYDKSKLRTTSKFVPTARIVPYKGMWIDFDFDQKDILYARFQKKKRLNAWVFLRAIGLELEDLLDIYIKEKLMITKENDKLVVLKEINPDILRYQRTSRDYPGVPTGSRFTRAVIDSLMKTAKIIEDRPFIEVSIEEFDPTKRSIWGTRVLAQSITKDGKIIAPVAEEITPELLMKLYENDITSIDTIWYDDVFISGSIIRTYKVMEKTLKIKSPEEAAIEFYRRTRPGEPTDPKVILNSVRNAFMNPTKFNLSRVGRIRISKRFDIEETFEIIITKDGQILKEIKEKFLKFQLASCNLELKDGAKINPGERIKSEHVKKLIENGIKYIPISEEELKEYAPTEDIKDESGEVIIPKKRNFEDHHIKILKSKGEEIKFKAYWYPNSLTYLDLYKVIEYLFDLRMGKEGRSIDDVDNLANRRVRPVGELIEMELARGIERIKRSIIEKLSTPEIEKKSLRDIVNFKPAASALKEFFAMGQLVQFLDNTNPLSELTHKRRLSALGTGGLRRETAGIEARDVHSSHYGKICPVETPEGQNVGLIVSMAAFSRIDELGLLQTPYRKVINGTVADEIEYISALDEEKLPIAPWGVEIDKNGKIAPEELPARVGTEIKLVKKEDIKYIDAVPYQILGVSASLIPFFEHNDSNRALMGSNMQRQAVPLLFTEPPLVGTEMEKIVAKNSLATVTARHAGIVKYVDSTRIVIEVDDPDFPELKGTADIYTLTKWSRTNQSTSINQRPIIRFGERVKRGQIIADGHATAGGELALGKNVLVAIMSWRGYNFEDSIVISERLVYDDVYTSVHIEELSIDIRQTKHGPEEITKDIPGVSTELVANLDEDGIVRAGVFVNPGDILVGKLTPVPEMPLTPEERLIKSIFGKAVENVIDTSLRCPPDIKGIVLSVFVHYRKDVVKDQRIKAQEEKIILRIRKDMSDAVEILRGKLWEGIGKYLQDIKVISPIKIDKNIFNDNTKEFREALVAKLKSYRETSSMVKFLESLQGNIDEESIKRISEAIKSFEVEEKTLKKIFEDKIAEVRKGEELPPGVLKRIRIFVASKRKIQVGDKLSGRHGNKGVVSVILPQEDMPFLPDGTPVDIILSPLGIPSRMNIGQLFELELGWISKELGRKIAQVVDKLQEEFIIKNKAQIKSKIMEMLTDGEDKTGIIEKFSKYIDGLNDEDFAKFVISCEKLGVRFSCPPFLGMTEEELKEIARRVGIPDTFSVELRDGITGDKFDQPVAVGYMYIMRLVHMVEDKIHARSTGTYSLITQQPLGGKSRGGGQRLGEMEVWALEAYGAAYTLQEMLTVKSDDISGRERTVLNIIEGKPVYTPSIPESFLVLVKELQAMGFDVELLSRRDLEELEAKKEETQEGKEIFIPFSKKSGYERVRKDKK